MLGGTIVRTKEVRKVYKMGKVEVEAREAEMHVLIQYTVRRTGETKTADFVRQS